MHLNENLIVHKGEDSRLAWCGGGGYEKLDGELWVNSTFIVALWVGLTKPPLKAILRVESKKGKSNQVESAQHTCRAKKKDRGATFRKRYVSEDGENFNAARENPGTTARKEGAALARGVRKGEEAFREYKQTLQSTNGLKNERT